MADQRRVPRLDAKDAVVFRRQDGGLPEKKPAPIDTWTSETYENVARAWTWRMSAIEDAGGIPTPLR